MLILKTSYLAIATYMIENSQNNTAHVNDTCYLCFYVSLVLTCTAQSNQGDYG